MSADVGGPADGIFFASIFLHQDFPGNKESLQVHIQPLFGVVVH